MNAGESVKALCFRMAASAGPAPAAAAAQAPEGVGGGQPLRVVFAGGGTGGHLFPGIAVAEEIRACSPRSRVLFISRGSEFERTVLGRVGFPLEPIAAEGLKGRGVWKQALALGHLPAGMWRSARLLHGFRPQLVVGLGSYAAGPVVAAAWIMRTPIALCEQNTLPGVTNRVLAHLADRIFTSFEHTGGGFDPGKVVWTGNPLRREIIAAGRRPAGDRPRDRFTVLVLGGSQGAHGINLAVVSALGHLSDTGRWSFVHQTGAADEVMVREAYLQAGFRARVQAFFDDMAEVYRSADLVVCRAGATTVAEITALGKAAIYIPFPHAADDHQRLNARRMVEAGAAEMIGEEALSGGLLSERIGFYASRPAELALLEERSAALGRPDAARRIVEECCRLISEKTGGRPDCRTAEERT